MSHPIRIIVTLLALLTIATGVMAQQSDSLIRLTEQSPAIDVVITLPPDTTGTIALETALVAVSLTDEAGNVVFSAADERLHGMELNIAPNTGTHTLSVQRLPGAVEAFVGVKSLNAMTLAGDVTSVEGSMVQIGEQANLSLSSSVPSQTASLALPENSVSAVSASFEGIGATMQFVDAEGVVLAEKAGLSVDGVTLLMDGGNYDFTVLGTNIGGDATVALQAVNSEVAGYTVIEAPATGIDPNLVLIGNMTTEIQVLDEAQAIAIAVAAYPGANALEAELEEEYGVLAWEVELDNGLEIYIDSETGAIVYEESDFEEDDYDEDEYDEDEYEDDEGAYESDEYEDDDDSEMDA